MKLNRMDGETRDAIITFVLAIWIFLVIISMGNILIKELIKEAKLYQPTQTNPTEMTGVLEKQ